MKQGMPWVKVWTDFIHDDKLAEVSRSARLRFVELLCLAGECDADGAIVNGEEALTTTRIAFRLHDSLSAVRADVDALIGLGVIEMDGDTIRIRNWEKRQGENWGQIKAKWRERQSRRRNVTRDMSNASHVSHANVTPREGEGEKKEKEKRTPAVAGVRTATAAAPVVPPPSTSQAPEHRIATTATPAIPDAMRTQKAPPRAKAGHLAWPKVAAFMRGMNLTHVSAERAALIEETCFAVTAEDVEKRAGEWLTRYGKPVKDETWGRAFDVCANGWAERKAIPAPAVFQPFARKGARPQVSYTDEQRAAAEARAREQLAEREGRIAEQGDATP